MYTCPIEFYVAIKEKKMKLSHLLENGCRYPLN